MGGDRRLSAGAVIRRRFFFPESVGERAQRPIRQGSRHGRQKNPPAPAEQIRGEPEHGAADEPLPEPGASRSSHPSYSRCRDGPPDGPS